MLRITPVVRKTVYTFEDLAAPEEKVVCSTISEDVGHLMEKPPAVYPEDAEILWHAISPENKLKLHQFANTEGADPALQRSQLQELFLKLDIYDSGDTIETKPWADDGEVLRVPLESLEALWRRYPELRNDNNTAPPGFAQGEEGKEGPGGEKNFSKTSVTAGPTTCTNQEGQSGSA